MSGRPTYYPGRIMVIDDGLVHSLRDEHSALPTEVSLWPHECVMLLSRPRRSRGLYGSVVTVLTRDGHIGCLQTAALIALNKEESSDNGVQESRTPRITRTRRVQ